MPQTRVHDLRCESLCEPLCVHAAVPQLSWKLASDGRGVRQVSYHVEASSSLEAFEAGRFDLWDSGEVPTDQALRVDWGGAALPSRTAVFWRVTVRDNLGGVATSENAATFEMGLLAESDWTAGWIAAADQAPVADPLVHDWCEAVVYRPETDPGYEREQKLDEVAVADRPKRIEAVKRALPATWLRTSFKVDKPVARARLYFACLGYAELHLNGQKLNDRVLDPAQTDYELRALYTVDSLNDRLGEGEHTLEVHLAEGWYGQSHGFFDPTFRYGKPLAKLQLEIEHVDGSRQTVHTDTTWQAARSELAKANLYSGEVCDLRVLSEGRAWGPVSGPDDNQPLPERLEPQQMPPARKTGVVNAESVVESSPGVWLVDFGINFTGWVSLEFEAPRGSVVDLTFAESVTPDRKLDWDTIGRRAVGVYQWDRVIAAGGGRETYEPRFTYHGFRYVQVSGLSGAPALSDIVGHFVRTDFPRTGTFACSDPFLNRLHETILWTYEANFIGIPADCPTREKCGWLDAYNTAEMVYHNWDIAPSLKKYIEDVRTSAALLGGLPGNVAPGRRNGMFEAFDWGISTVLLPIYLHTFTGDLRTAEAHWGDIVRYLDFADKRYPNRIASGSLGDWCDQPATLELSFTRVDGSPFNSHPATTATLHWFFATRGAAELARALGKPTDVVDDLLARAEQIRLAINETFFHKRAMTFNSQTENAMALVYGVVDPANRQAVADRLAEEVVYGNGGHFNVGAHGASFLYHALSNHGHADVALDMFEKEDYPSYRYMFAQGATTIWENMSRWDPVRMTTSKTLSHPFQSGFHHWFHNAIGGVQRDPAAVGFGKLIFLPQTVGRHTHGEAGIETPHGHAASHWTLEATAFRWTLDIPVNTTATVVVPETVRDVQLDGAPAPLAPRDVLGRSRAQTCELGSGHWVFTGHRPDAPMAPSVARRLG